MMRLIWLSVLAIFLMLAVQTATDAQVRGQLWFGAARIGGSVAHEINGFVAVKIPLG